MQYVKTFEMRMFNEKFTKSSWQHSAQWNILHFPDVQYRADGQTKYRAHFGVWSHSFTTTLAAVCRICEKKYLIINEVIF